MRMFKAAEDFFESIGLYPMTQVFWDRSVINQTAWGKMIVCHASAEDFCLGPDGDDYRYGKMSEVIVIIVSLTGIYIHLLQVANFLLVNIIEICPNVIEIYTCGLMIFLY